MLAVVLAAAVLITVVVGLLWRRPPRNAGRVLSLLAVASAVVVSVGALPLALDDAGPSGAAVTVAPPVLITGVAAAVSWLSRAPGIVAAWLAAVLMIAYVLVFGLGLGLFYAPTALLALASAIVGSARPAGATDRAA